MISDYSMHAAQGRPIMIALLIVTLIASSTSVNNPYGRFGSKFSSTSANNPYAVDTPQLVEKKGDVCPVSRKCPSNSSICKSRRQSANKFDPDSINNRYDFQYGPILRDLIEAGHVQNARQRGQETLDGCEARDIINDGKNRGKLSANKFDPNSIENPYSVKYDKPLVTSRQILRQEK